MAQKTLADLAEIFLAKKRTWNVDTSLRFAFGGVEIGTIAVTGKIEYLPSEGKKTAKQSQKE